MTLTGIGSGFVPARVMELQARFNATSTATGTSSASGTAFASALAQADGSSGGSATGDAIVAEAQKYKGVPYVWGGNDPNTGLDCSGFTKLVCSKFGIELPRVACDQARVGQPVSSIDQAKPGDLLFFGSPVTHTGIYMGNGKMIDASRRQNAIVVRDLWEPPSAIRRVAATSTGAASSYSTASFGSTTGALKPSTPYAALFEAAGARYGIDPKVLAAVAKTESNFNPSAGSPAGAQGMMQFMPATARSMGVNPWDPASAVDGAGRLLAQNLKQFGSIDLALAAYNAGPGAVQRYGGIPPYKETQAYVQRVLQFAQGSV